VYIYLKLNVQETTVRTGHGTTDWFQIGEGVCQSCISSPCLFNLYAEYIMRNAGLEETQAGIKIARRNINNLRYADDTREASHYCHAATNKQKHLLEAALTVSGHQHKHTTDLMMQ